MDNFERWPLLCSPVELSDEAAVQIAEFLMDLALWFESTHLSQMRRHRQTMREQPLYNPYQLELFDPF